MSSPTQITSGPVQPAQQDARSIDTQKTDNKPEPRTGNQKDHGRLYSPNQGAALAKSLRAGSKKQAGADAAKLAESTGLPKAEEHIAAPRNLPAHIEQLLDKQDQETYTKSWGNVPAVPKHVKSLDEYMNIRTAAMEHIGALLDLEAKCLDILQSRLATTEPSEGKDKLDTLQEQITQSQADLEARWGVFQMSAAYGVPLAKAASAA